MDGQPSGGRKGVKGWIMVYLIEFFKYTTIQHLTPLICRTCRGAKVDRAPVRRNCSISVSEGGCQLNKGTTSAMEGGSFYGSSKFQVKSSKGLLSKCSDTLLQVIIPHYVPMPH
jgi:hypothetical protein